MTAIRGVAYLLLLQAAGEAFTHYLGLPFPGPVIGLVLLLGLLSVASVREPVSVAADMLLSNLSLLFIPVGVGIITHLGLVSSYGIPLLVVIVVSTWLGMATTALVMEIMGNPSSSRRRDLE